MIYIVFFILRIAARSFQEIITNNNAFKKREQLTINIAARKNDNNNKNNKNNNDNNESIREKCEYN